MITYRSKIVFTIMVLLACGIVYPQQFQKIYQTGKIDYEKVFTIGGENDVETMLVMPAKIAVDKKNNFFVLDFKESCIYKFDENGKLLLKIGREGHGPGELSMCTQMAVDPNGRIIAYEAGNRRFSIFENDGKFIKSVPCADQLYDFKIAKDGNMYGELHEYDFSGNNKGTIKKVVQFDSEFKVDKTIASEVVNELKIISLSENKIALYMFPETICWCLTPDSKVIVAFTKDYSVKIFNSSGKLEKEFTHESKKERVTQQDKDDFMNAMKNSQISAAAAAFKDNIIYPDYKPYFQSVFTDSEGNILIGTYMKSVEDQYYDVFSKDGKFINNVKLPNIIFRPISIFSKNNVYTIKGGGEEYAEAIKYTIK